jgi:hypothetical protein
MADEKPDDAAVAEAQENADFDSGFGVKPAEKIPAKEKPEPAATPRAEAKPAPKPEAKPEPKYIQVTEADWAEVRAAAAKTASYDSQLSKAFGTIGNLQKLVNGLQPQATPAAVPAAARKVEISKAAFAEMEKDFPELAQQTRAALEAALSGLPGHGANDVDATKIEAMLVTWHTKREVRALEEDFPDWREIVGAVDVTKEQPNKDNPFRKWLGSKDTAYQNRINGSESAQVIGRAIRLFQNETKAAPAKPAATPRDTARAERIRSAVQPRGDNAGAAPGKTDDDEFVAGFNGR